MYHKQATDIYSLSKLRVGGEYVYRAWWFTLGVDIDPRGSLAMS